MFQSSDKQSDTLPVVDDLNVDQFMGAWYVIAHIPPFLTDDAYNAVERYRKAEDDKVDVLYTYNEGSFTGDLKTMTPTGFTDEGDQKAEWGMRILWPFKSDYRIVYLDDAYQNTIVGRNARDYLWIMSRTPIMDTALYQELTDRVSAMGYDARKLRRVPQQQLSDREMPLEAIRFLAGID